MSSGDPGLVIPVDYIPLLRGDSLSGQFAIDIDLAEMPKPLLNGVVGHVQAWYVPKLAFPQFTGNDEFMHSYQGTPIKALGAADRTPPSFFTVLDSAQSGTVASSAFYKTLGLHRPASTSFNTELIDAFVTIYNYRLAGLSSKLARKKYAVEDLDEAIELPPAIWPSIRYGRVVPDYEEALIVGSMEIDLPAGGLPLDGKGLVSLKDGAAGLTQRLIRASDRQPITGENAGSGDGASGLAYKGTGSSVDGGKFTAKHRTGGSNQSPQYQDVPAVYDPNGALEVLLDDVLVEAEGQGISLSVASFDKARVRQAMAKARAAYAGTDYTGFLPEAALAAELMQGWRIPDHKYREPWLLDQARVSFGMIERHATDGASLDQSVSQGRASASLRLNVPANDYGGCVIITLEVYPERVEERQSDEWLFIDSTSKLPDALRDIQREVPVDTVLNRRLDAKHTTPNALYGYEPMNDVWNRRKMRLGGQFYQATPGTAWTEARSQIWMPEVVDPVFGTSHYLAPKPFPKNVFSYQDNPAFEFTCRHQCVIVGLTQIGDVLRENNDDFEAVSDASM